MSDIMGGFVELDQHKLSRDQLVMLGMREALEKWINELMAQAAMTEHPGIQHVLRTVSDKMTADRDAISVSLTRSAFMNKAGTFTSLKGVN